MPQIFCMKIEPMATSGVDTKLLHGTTPMMEKFMVKYITATASKLKMMERGMTFPGSRTSSPI